MRRWLRLALCALAPLAGCGPVSAPGEATSTDQSAIQDGAVDTTHTFAVGIAQLSKLQVGQIAFCSGVLLAPNLVATARHCVANLASPEIFCATSNFGSVVPANDVLVTTDTTISPNGNLLGVSSIIVPSGPNQTGVCGNDIALLILDGSIKLPQYVTPVFNPPMTDSSAYSTNVTAIGYGVSSPVDEAGSTAGERRIKENIKLSCISNDPNFVDCLQSANASQVLSAGEFVSGDASTCDGDSGSGAYDQASFDRGEWVAFGVLSRGAVSADGDTCIEPIYERFDAWGSLLVSAAKQAASLGRYTAPAWATGASSALASDGAAPGVVGVSGNEGLAMGSPGGGCSVSRSGRVPPAAPGVFAVALLALTGCHRRRRRALALHISAPTAGTCSQNVVAPLCQATNWTPPS